MKDHDKKYIAEYIKRSLNSNELEPVDEKRAGEHWEMLKTLYDTHQRGGKKAVRPAWEAIKRLNPAARILEIGMDQELIHADDLGSIGQPDYLLTSYPIYRCGFNVLVGESGVGKSFIALDIAGRLAVNASVVYVAGEGLAGYAARWFAWKDYHHIEGQTHLYFYKNAVQVLNESELEMFISLIAQHDPELVIIDTLARSAVGVDENSNKEMGQFVAACDHIRNSLDAAVIVVHHTGKSGDIRGATALYGAADSVLMARNDDGMVRIINENGKGGKNKYNEAATDKTYIIASHVGTDVTGRCYEGAVLKEAELYQISQEALSGNQSTILKFIRDYGEAGIDVKGIITGTEIAQSTVYRTLGKFLEGGYLEKVDSNYTITDEGKNLL